MIHFLEHTPSGQILRTATASVALASDITKSAPGNTIRVFEQPQSMVPNSYWDGTAIAHLPAQPSRFHVVDWTAKTWVDPRTLQDFKDARWEEIKAARDAAEFGVFTWDGSTFDCDAESQTRIRAAADRARRIPTTSLAWKLADNSSRTLLAPALDALGNALDVHVGTQHAVAAALYEQIKAATSVAALQNIHWPA